MSKKIVQTAALTILGLLILGVVIALIAKDVWATQLLESRVKRLTGFETQASGVSVDLAKASITVERLQIYNPSGYSEKIFVDGKQFIFEASSWGDLLSASTVWKKISGALEAIYVEHKKDGSLNLRDLALLAPAVVEGLKTENSSSKGKIQRMELEYGKLKLREVALDDKITDSEVDFKGRKEVLGNIAHPEVIFYAGIAKILGSLNRGSLGLPRAALQQAILKSTGYNPQPMQVSKVEKAAASVPDVVEKLPA